MIANGILTFWRRYAPLLAICAIAGTIGVTMVHILGADERIDPWIAYGILIGIGVGIVPQVPMIPNQAAVRAEDMAAAPQMTFLRRILTPLHGIDRGCIYQWLGKSADL